MSLGMNEGWIKAVPNSAPRKPAEDMG
jgi:hypothetical protein